MRIEKIEKSNFTPEKFNIPHFGTTFGDHMLIAHFKDGKWSEPVIKPYGKLEFTPAMMAINYGQAVFEGMKCYKGEDNEIYLFRPEKNFERINKSATRLDMPTITEEIFMDGIKTLVDLDRQWVPKELGTSLYLRPLIFSSEEAITARSSNEYIFTVVTAVAPNYYNKPLAVKIANEYSRAAKDGVGFTKAAGNYAASFYPAKLAREEGYDQVIWTDDTSHTYIEEAGTMNVFVRIDDKLLTAPVSERILNGVTRDSIIQLAKSEGITVEERKISVEEMYTSHKDGRLKEVFGVGTAVVLNNFSAVGYAKERLALEDLPIEDSFGKQLKNKLINIQTARSEDIFDWRVKVEPNLIEA